MAYKPMRYSGRFILTIVRKSGYQYKLNLSKWDDVVDVMKRLRRRKNSPKRFEITWSEM